VKHPASDPESSVAELAEFAAPVTPAGAWPARRGVTWSRLTSCQRQLWTDSGLAPACHLVAAWRITGELSVIALREALRDVVGHHDALRAKITLDDAEPMFRYATETTSQFVVSETPALLSSTEDNAFVERIAGQPVPADRAPLLRVGLLRSTAEHKSCLVLSLHRLIADWHALTLVVASLAAAYQARAERRRPDLRHAPSFAQYAEEQARLVDSPQWRADLDYWLRRLADAPANLAIPFRSPVPDGPSITGTTYRRELGSTRSRRMTDFAREQLITPATLLTSCVAVVLSAWSGQPELVLGVPVSRRRSDRDDRLVGSLAETLPLRVTAAGHPDFLALLAHVRRRHAEALRHSLPSFDAILKQLGIPPGTPLFRVQIDDRIQTCAGSLVPGVKAEQIQAERTPVMNDLVFALWGGESLRLDLVHVADRLSAEVAGELLDQCLLVLDQAMRQPDLAPQAMDLRTGRSMRLRAIAGRIQPLSSGPILTDRVLDVAGRNPDRIAVLTEGRELTYGDLAARVVRVADDLVAVGVRPGMVVEVRAARSVWLPTVLLAVWRVGAVVGLLDPTQPSTRFRECVRQLRAGAVVAFGLGDTQPVIAPGGHDPRYLPDSSHAVFARGSGDQPIGVVIPVGSLEATLAWYVEQFDIRPTDRFVMCGSLGDASILDDMFAPLLSGAAMIVPPENDHEAASLVRLLHSGRITVLHTNPALLELILAGQAERGGRLPGSLRLVVCGGAPLTARLVRRLRAVATAELVNAYSKAETSQMAAWYRVVDDLPAPDNATIPIGLATPGNDLAVINSAGALTGIGELGEVVVCGGRLATGYLRPGKRAGGFAHDPLGLPGIRAFHTDDHGRVDPWGRIHLASRPHPMEKNSHSERSVS
jgi:non-ribosomal peptide synthetase component F